MMVFLWLGLFLSLHDYIMTLCKVQAMNSYTTWCHNELHNIGIILPQGIEDNSIPLGACMLILRERLALLQNFCKVVVYMN